MRTVAGWIVAYLFRWLPHSTTTGLFPVGEPDASSPVVVTGNFSLTVKRVRRALEERSLWLLVARSDGINVWCAADGGILTENRIVDAIKVSRITDKVAHRELILPPLAAPGVDRDAIERETGFRARFGPVYARDIPAYLDAGKHKTASMRLFDFGPRHRLDMFLPMNFPAYLLVAVVLAVLSPGRLPGFTILFWSAVAFLYVFLDAIPGKTGWGHALWSAVPVVLLWAGMDWRLEGDALAHWGWLLATFAVFFAAGFDLAGTVAPRRSDPELMMHRLGVKRLGALFAEKALGEVRLDRERCRGCETCAEICPVGVFAELDADRKTTFRDQRACFACGACVKQCPEGALSLGGNCAG